MVINIVEWESYLQSGKLQRSLESEGEDSYRTT